MRNFEFAITYRCNVVCEYCNRLVGVIKLDDSDITLAQVKRYCDQLKAANWFPDKVKISGGEPRVHPQLDAIQELIKQELGARAVWTLTNDLPETETAPYPQDKGHTWKGNPLPKANHDPFLVSPVDAGMTEHQNIPACKSRRICGRLADAYGFSFCPVAPLLGRLLRINPYSPEPYIEQDHRICQHCPDSLPEEPRQELFEWAKQGNYPSPTFKAALKKYRELPIVYPRTDNVPLQRLVNIKDPFGAGSVDDVD